MLMPALGILPASQLSFWNEEKGIPNHFVLYGRTALALCLGQRHALDFDFPPLRSIWNTCGGRFYDATGRFA